MAAWMPPVYGKAQNLARCRKPPTKLLQVDRYKEHLKFVCLAEWKKEMEALLLNMIQGRRLDGGR